MAETSLSVPVAQVAKIFNITERRVQQLASDGIIPKAERGRYHFIESVQGYIKFLQERAFGKSDNTTDSHHERTRLLRAKANLTELEHGEKIGQLVSAEVIRRQDAALATILRNNLESVADRVSPIVAAESDGAVVHEIISREVRQILADIAAAMASTEVDDARLDITRRESLHHLDEQAGGVT